MRYPFLAFLTVFLTALPSVFSEDTADSLALLMGDEVFTSAGMDKLSAAEQAALLQWLQSRDSVMEEEMRAEAVAEAEAQLEERVAQRIEEEKERESKEKRKRSLDLFGLVKPDPDLQLVIESRIPGKFIGWMGNTIFVLENGQVWRQRTAGKYYYPLTDPEVTIRKETMGYWMIINKTRARVGVERIK